MVLRRCEEKNGVAIIVDEELMKKVVEVMKINDRMMTITLALNGLLLALLVHTHASGPGRGGKEELLDGF